MFGLQLRFSLGVSLASADKLLLSTHVRFKPNIANAAKSEARPSETYTISTSADVRSPTSKRILVRSFGFFRLDILLSHSTSSRFAVLRAVNNWPDPNLAVTVDYCGRIERLDRSTGVSSDTCWGGGFQRRESNSLLSQLRLCQ